jgi:chromosome segregation ATPase
MAVYQPKGANAGSTATIAPSSTSTTSASAFEVHAPNPTDADGLRAELAREQERLRKLWDAFKAQEDELTALKSTASTSTLSSTSAADARSVAALQREVELLSGDLRRAGEQQRRLEEENVGLREQSRAMDEVGRRAASLQSDLEQERERLAKLYVVYEEVEAERARLEQHLKEWDAWYHGVAPHLAEICRSIGGAPHQR